MSARTQILERFLDEVWNQGDADAVDRYLAPRYAIKHDPGDLWHGRTLSIAEFKERLAVSRAPFPQERFDAVEMVEQGDVIAVSWTWRGVHSGDIPGFPATGREIEMSGITLYYFEGDRISGHWQIVDRLGVAMQLQANRG
ncbi:MAG TPA: ester cyclase [Vitreimonas sp.]|jgi:steroid delta-isomerase-like uncharacterized protein|nr:ester cyclase [Vitreimonas sp.]